MKVKINKTSTIISFVIILLAIGGLIFYYNDTDQISYKNRTYNKSSNEVIDANLQKCLDVTKTTGKHSKGMEIYDVDNNPNDSTIIFLKTTDGRFLTYALSGGP